MLQQTTFTIMMDATISADSLNISYNSFYNEGIITDGITYYFGNIFIENINNLPIIPDGTTSTRCNSIV